MAGGGSGDRETQLLTVIRDFASERSQGEKRVSDLKRRLHDLRAEFDAATANLENAKRCKEEAEKDLKGSEVELSMADASILAQQARTRSLQDEIAKVGEDVTSLKSDSGFRRDEFIGVMYEFNSKIRTFQQTMAHHLAVQESSETSSIDGEVVKKSIMCEDENLKGEIAYANAQVLVAEQEYQESLTAHDEILQVLSDTERMTFLAESVIEEMKTLQELGEYPLCKTTTVLKLCSISYFCPKQTAEAEKIFANLGEELRMRYVCPRCGINNMVTLSEEGS